MNVESLDLSIQPRVQAFFDTKTNTVSYVVSDPAFYHCAVIDSVLDFDYASGRISYSNADQIIQYIEKNGLNLGWIIETHIHADHLSAAQHIQHSLGGITAISKNVGTVQRTFADIYNESTDFHRDGSQFDKLLSDSEGYRIGEMTALAIDTPGHTPACMAHIIGDAVFVGDTLFMPDGGTARADFPGGDAGQLYDSIQRLFTLPDEMRLFICHDYGPGNREVCWETTIGEQRKTNIHVGQQITRDQYINTREQRDATLSMPDLMIPSIQVNMRGGVIPKDNGGRKMLKVPVDAL